MTPTDVMIDHSDLRDVVALLPNLTFFSVLAALVVYDIACAGLAFLTDRFRHRGEDRT